MIHKRILRHWLIYGLLALTIGSIAAAGLLVGSDAPAPAGVAAPETSVPMARAITPRLLSNATLRATPTPIPSVVPSTTSAADPPIASPAIQPLPTWRPLAPDAQEPLPPLVFARHGQIWISDGTTDPPRQLTDFTDGVYAGQPDISPDGTQIAFVTLVPPPITATMPIPSSQLFTMQIDGSGLRAIWSMHEGILWMPSWTPDGTALYLLANSTYTAPPEEDPLDHLAIVRFDLETKVSEVVVTGALDPVISRDGTQLAYLKFDDFGMTMHLDVSTADGGSAQRLIDGTSFDGLFAPRFSPDGQQIVVAAIGGLQTDEQGYPIRNAEQSLFDTVLGFLEPPTAEAHGAPWDLWVVNIDGTGLRRLTSIYEDLPMAAFSPDGSEMVLMGYNGFYRMNTDGSDLRRISPDGDHGSVDWMPARR